MTGDEDLRPQRGARGGWALLFAFVGGPLAWFAQENIDYGLYAHNCYPGPERFIDLPDASGWVHVVGPLALAICVGVALLATWTAWRIYARTRAADDPTLVGAEGEGNGRTRFIAFWGLLTSSGFGVVTLLNLIAIVAVPPCVL